ncbi:MAG: nucleotide pyrophosphohydrolase [Caldiserica bacterium]|nr:MAG: nucleotide pyrophosphohydrolase [Caldisericota bacterium]
MKRSKRNSISALLRVISILRGKKGCRWDKKQTHISLIPSLREETRELEEALKKGNPEEIKEELADVLHQILFHCRIEKEKGNFDFYDVCDFLVKKLRRRHPHVFTKKKLNSVKEILRQWKRIKEEERNEKIKRDTFKGKTSGKTHKRRTR